VKATEVTAGLTESNGSLLPGLWRDSLHVTCGLTACTPRSAPGPTFGNEYGKTFFYLYNMSNYGRRAFCFAGRYVWNSLPEHIRQSAFSINSCLQALTKTISTPPDIAPSGLETIVFYCFMGYISALTYYLCLSNSMIPGKQFSRALRKYHCR